jgi:hypothetical protein
MKVFAWSTAFVTHVALAFATCVSFSSAAFAQSFTLDPASVTGLGAAGATSADVLTPAVAPVPGPMPPAMIGMSAAELELLPGDVIDAMTYGDDGGMAAILHFSVDRASISAGATPTPPDVFTEVTPPPAGMQGEAAGDMFTSFNPSCPPTPHTQIVDGDGLLTGPISCYGGFGLGITEALVAPGPPLVDNINAFDWGAPGKQIMFCMGFSLAPGSPTLMGANPLLPAGAGPADILVACPGAPATWSMFFPAALLG